MKHPNSKISNFHRLREREREGEREGGREGERERGRDGGREREGELCVTHKMIVNSTS